MGFIARMLFGKSKRQKGKRKLHTWMSSSNYGTITETAQGETVKSHAEARIANYFNNQGVRYSYEPQLRKRSGRKFAKPDFYLPDLNVYVEYWGLTSSPEYVKTMKWKMAQYHDQGIEFISLYPQNLDNLDWIFKAKLRKLGKEIPRSG